MKRPKMKKLLSLLMAVCLILSVMPISSFTTVAADSTAEYAATVSDFSVSANANTFTVTRTSTTNPVKLFYRTQDGSAVAGIHYTAKSGVLSFAAGESSKTVTVTESSSVSAENKYYDKNTASNRTYQFIVSDTSGLNTKSITRSISYSSYAIDGRYFANDDTDGTSSGGNTSSSNISYSTSLSSSSIKVTDSGYSQGVYSTSTSGFFSAIGTNGENYAEYTDSKLAFNLQFNAYESADGYEHLQILTDNTSTYDGWKAHTQPVSTYSSSSLSVYAASFEHSTSKNTTSANYIFPVRNGTMNASSNSAANRWNSSSYWSLSNSIGVLHYQMYNSYKASMNSDYSYVLVDPSVSSIDVRFDTSGEDDDIWYVTDGKVNFRAYDSTAPTASKLYAQKAVRIGLDDSVTMAVKFSEIVKVTGTPTLTTNQGTFTYAGGSGTNVLYFTGTLDITGDTTVKATAISGTIKDCAGNSYSTSTTLSLTDTATVEVTPSGSGTSSSPYLISNAEELYWFAAKVNSGSSSIYGKLTDDIVINDDVLNSDLTLNGTPNRSYVPINASDSTTFTADFYGNNHTVSGIYTTGYNYAGFIGYTKGDISNVGVIDSYICGSDYEGAVVGYASSGTVSSCYSIAYVDGKTDDQTFGGGIGGVLANIENCYSASKMGSYVNYCGSIAGKDFDSSTVFTNCYYDSSVANYSACGKSYSTSSTATKKTTAEFASGEVCYLLNSGTTDGTQAYYQDIDNGSTDAYPSFSGGTVYKVNYLKCDGETQTGDIKYTNTDGDITLADEHTEYNYNVNASSPTLISKGYTGDTVCAGCGTTIEYGEEISMLDGSAYYAALEEAQALDSSLYSSSTYALVTQALSDYSQDIVEAYTTQADVDAATAALNAAVDGLALLYPLYINGTQVDSSTASDILGDGTAAYDNATNTLTLTNFSLTANSQTNAIKATSDLNIVLVGDNTVQGGTGYGSESRAKGGSGSTAIEVSGALAISGSGTLTVTGGTGGIAAQYGGSGATAISASGGITINNTTVTANGGSGGNSVYYGTSGKGSTGAAISGAVAFNGGTLVANGSTALSEAPTFADGVTYFWRTSSDGDYTSSADAAYTYSSDDGYAEITSDSDAFVTVVFVYNGGEKVTQYIESGATPTVPETNTEATCTSNGDNTHTVTTYSWQEVSAVYEDTVYNEQSETSTEDCSFVEEVVTESTYTSTGLTKYTCSLCGNSYEAEIAMLDGTKYYAALANAQAIDSSFYTDESYAVLEQALSDYSKDIVEAYTSQDDVDAAAAALNAAIDGLVAITYPVYINGTQVNILTASDILGDGTASYDSETNTLTLTNFNLTASDGTDAIKAECDLNIVLVGDNTVTGGACYGTGISVEGALTIDGEGTLTVTGGETDVNATSFREAGSAISATGGFTLNGGTVEAYGGDVAEDGKGFNGYAVEGAFTYNGGHLIASVADCRDGGNGKNKAFSQTPQTADGVTYYWRSCYDTAVDSYGFISSEEMSYVDSFEDNWYYHYYDEIIPDSDGYSKVTFDLNGHGEYLAYKSVYLKNGAYLIETEYSKNYSNTLEDDEYYFMGWYWDAECTDAVDYENDAITSDVTVYAKWSSFGGLNVNGITVTEDNCADILGDGSKSAVFDFDTYTLTLTNAAIESPKYNGGIDALGSITIKLVGDNTVQGGYFSYGIYCKGNLTITGDGTLTVTGGDSPYSGCAGISLYKSSGNCGTLTLESGTVTVAPGEGETEGDYANAIRGSVLYNGGTLIASAEECAVSEGVTISDTANYNWRTSSDGDYTSSSDAAYVYSETDAYVELVTTAKPEFTVSFVYANGDTETQTVLYGETPTVPETNTETTYTSIYHNVHTVTTYSWPDVSAVYEDTEYKEQSETSTEDCSFVEEETITKPTLVSAGTVMYTCSLCGYSYLAETELLSGTEYYAALAKAQAIDSSSYTADSYAVLEQALTDYAQDIVEAYTTQDEIDAAAAALNAAVDGLVELYPVYINGTQVNASNALDVLGDGTVVYDNSSNTLTLTNFNLTANTTTNAIKAECDLNIVINGDNTVTGGNGVNRSSVSVGGVGAAGIYVTGKLTVSGSGTLTVTGGTGGIGQRRGGTGGTAISASNGIVIDNATVTANGGTGGRRQSGLRNGSTGVALSGAVTFNGGTLIASGNEALSEAPTVADGISYYWRTSSDGDYTSSIYEAYAYSESDTYVELTQNFIGDAVDISVTANDYATTTLDGYDSTNGHEVTVAKNSYVELTAQETDDVKFVGWSVNGKIVSEDENYTVAAVIDTVYTPVYEASADSEFTVNFIDPYGNVISSSNVTSASEITIPDAPLIAGYTFSSWSMTDEEIAALTSGATIVAQYTKDEVQTYTVKASGATISADGNTADDEMSGLTYDTLVTVTAENAQAWMVDGVVVGYGDTYSFYIGSDIELTIETESVNDVKPTVAIVSADPVSSGSYKISFMATKVVPDGYTVLQSGFVYGKNLTDEDLVLENVGKTGSASNAGTVKVIYNKTTADQFAVNYGIKAMTGTASAKAFIVYTDESGEINVAYSDYYGYTY